MKRVPITVQIFAIVIICCIAVGIVIKWHRAAKQQNDQITQVNAEMNDLIAKYHEHEKIDITTLEIDVWGNPYLINYWTKGIPLINRTDHMTIRSAGPDGEYSTKDDLVVNHLIE